MGLQDGAGGVVALLILVIIVMRTFAASIYDFVIVSMTNRWYEAVLEELPTRASVLDVGMGTGTALVCNKTALLNKGLSFTGVDYNSTYVDAARKNMTKAGLSKYVHCLYGSVYEVDQHPQLPKEKFSAIYFSGSFSLMPSPPEALRATASLLKPGGKIYITQTFQKKAMWGMRTLKPLLKFITTIDFGGLVMEHEVATMVKAAGMRVERSEKIAGSVDNVWQAAYLVVIDPSEPSPQKRDTK